MEETLHNKWNFLKCTQILLIKIHIYDDYDFLFTTKSSDPNH